MNMKNSETFSTLWQINFSFKDSWNPSVEHLMKHITRKKTYFAFPLECIMVNVLLYRCRGTQINVRPNIGISRDWQRLYCKRLLCDCYYATRKFNRVLAIGRNICFRKQSDQFTKRNHLLVSIVVPAAIQLIQIKCVLIIFDGLNFNHKFLSCLQFEFLLQKSSSNSRERAHKWIGLQQQTLFESVRTKIRRYYTCLHITQKRKVYCFTFSCYYIVINSNDL